ncbi:hypothetical protein [Methanobrevibacter sp.]|uniref:hypothetical protein n=1 Tax=Methanobrevibacter sp. TaxID=66852 RepID=UPI00388FF7F3
MDKPLKNFVYDFLNIKEIIKYEFQTICGFTFVFKKEEIQMNNQISSLEIKPVGIIYEENDEFYFAPLYDKVEIGEVIKRFVEEFI